MRLFLMLTLVGGLSFGAVAPQFQGELMSGGKVSLKASLKKDRALLVCFWASWCTPCIAELRSVLAKMKEDPNLPLDLLTVNVDTSETSTDVKPTMKLYSLDMAVVLDPKHEIFSKYQEQKQLPYSVLIKSNGEIAKTFTGYHEEMFQVVREAVAPK